MPCQLLDQTLQKAVTRGYHHDTMRALATVTPLPFSDPLRLSCYSYGVTASVPKVGLEWASWNILLEN